MGPFSKNLDFNLSGIIKKIFYEHRDYESQGE